MSDTVKLIIEIPKETYKGIMLGKWDDNGLAFYVKTGTPLDKIRKEVMEYIDDLDIAYEICGVFDNIGKAESEIHCNCTDEEVAKSFISDVEAVKDLLPRAESEVSE